MMSLRVISLLACTLPAANAIVFQATGKPQSAVAASAARAAKHEALEVQLQQTVEELKLVEKQLKVARGQGEDAAEYAAETEDAAELEEGEEEVEEYEEETKTVGEAQLDLAKSQLATAKKNVAAARAIAEEEAELDTAQRQLATSQKNIAATQKAARMQIVQKDRKGAIVQKKQKLAKSQLATAQKNVAAARAIAEEETEPDTAQSQLAPVELVGGNRMGHELLLKDVPAVNLVARQSAIQTAPLQAYIKDVAAAAVDRALVKSPLAMETATNQALVSDATSNAGMQKAAVDRALKKVEVLEKLDNDKYAVWAQHRKAKNAAEFAYLTEARAANAAQEAVNFQATKRMQVLQYAANAKKQLELQDVDIKKVQDKAINIAGIDTY